MNLKKPILSSVLFFAFCSFFQPCFSTNDIINITISDLEPNLKVLQGECKTIPFHITNRYDEPVHIYYKIDKPSDMEITPYPKDYTMLNPDQTIAGNLKVCVNDLENDTYKIKFWLETLTKVNESRVRSEKYGLDVEVLYNPDLEIKTTTVIETTSIETTKSTTFPLNTTTLSTTRKADMKTNKTWETDKKKLVIIGIIVLLSIMILLPYLTFTKEKRSEEAKALFFSKNK